MSSWREVGYADLERSRAAAEDLARLVPGAGHTYAKGPDQYPEGMAPVIARGRGARVWDVDGNEYIEFGSGLRSVTLGHAHPRVNARVAASLSLGSNFVRPSALEIDAARRVIDLFPAFDRVKFAKNGSDVTTAAVRLARAHTGRDLVAVCDDQPFFSVDDWFMGHTALHNGIPGSTSALTVGFPYGDLAAVEDLFARYPERIACLVLEPAAAAEPPEGYLAGLRRLCDEQGTLLVFDEMITGFRWDLRGAHALYGVRPDLATFGKALGNGFPVSALLGRAEVMRHGDSDDDRRVFLLSYTHGGDAVGLAAALAVIDVYTAEPVIETMYARGERLRRGIAAAAAAAGVGDHLRVLGRSCNLVFQTLDDEGRRSDAFRTVFLQTLIRRGILAPSFVVSAALTVDDIDTTVDAVAEACVLYRKALDRGVEHYLDGRPVRAVFAPRG